MARVGRRAVRPTSFTVPTTRLCGRHAFWRDEFCRSVVAINSLSNIAYTRATMLGWCDIGSFGAVWAMPLVFEWTGCGLIDTPSVIPAGNMRADPQTHVVGVDVQEVALYMRPCKRRGKRGVVNSPTRTRAVVAEL